MTLTSHPSVEQHYGFDCGAAAAGWRADTSASYRRLSEHAVCGSWTVTLGEHRGYLLMANEWGVASGARNQ